MEDKSNSEVAQIMRQIDLQQETAQRGLHGFAIAARHDFINARMQRGGERILRLIEQGKHQEAQALMNTGDWGDRRPPMPKRPRHVQAQKKGKQRRK